MGSMFENRWLESLAWCGLNVSTGVSINEREEVMGLKVNSLSERPEDWEIDVGIRRGTSDRECMRYVYNSGPWFPSGIHRHEEVEAKEVAGNRTEILVKFTATAVSRSKPTEHACATRMVH